MDGNSNVNVSDIRLFDVVLEFAGVVKTMVAHFVCVLFTAFIIYTAQPGTSKSWIIYENSNYRGW